MKGLIFAGDSFTWGQGLYFYSDLPRIYYPKDFQYVDQKVTKAQRNYKDSVRYSRLVSNYFNTFEITINNNGGSDYSSLNFIDDIFREGIFYDDIDYVILQTTQFNRSIFQFDLEGKTYSTYVNNYNSLSEFFNIWMEKNNYNFEDYIKLHTSQIIKKIKDKFIKLENNGIKSRIICWTNDYVDSFQNDDYLNKKYIKINYFDKDFLSIQDLMDNHEQLMISKNTNYFRLPPEDNHISLIGHKIIADSIINNIKSHE